MVDRWGYCGVVAVQDERIIGYLTLAPAVHVPRLGAFATTPVSPDAAVVVSGLVIPAHRGHGVGRQLVQSAAGLVARRDIRALEAVGSYAPGPSCLLPLPEPCATCTFWEASLSDLAAPAEHGSPQ